MAAPAASAPALEAPAAGAPPRSPSVPAVPPAPPTPGLPNIAHAAVVLALLDQFNGQVARDNAGWVRAYARAHLPQEQAHQLAAEEATLEVAFAKNTRQRAQDGMARALSIEDPEQRQQAVRGLLTRERFYAVLRSEAVAVRAKAMENRTSVRHVSPLGAFWMLNPLVKEHTPDCVALSGRAWPWSVLDRIRPPRHAGCRCYLIALADALRRGEWNGVLPTHEEAEGLAEMLLPENDDH